MENGKERSVTFFLGFISALGLFAVLANIIDFSGEFKAMEATKKKIELCESIGGEAELSGYLGGVKLDSCKNIIIKK